MNKKYEPELDFGLLRDWCAFCEGVGEFPDDHFSTILMEVFVGDLTPEVDRFLREFTQYFPHSLYDSLVRIGGGALPDREVLPWVQRDLDEKRKVLASRPKARKALKVIDGRRFAFTHDHGAMLEIAVASPTHSVLYDTVGDFVTDRCNDDARLLTLSEALYHIATNRCLADSIMAPLLPTDIDLSHYLEIYLRGGDYVLDTDRIVIFTGPPVKDGIIR